MFKQIFENKIGEKLNTFNNSGKAAFEWMDKFRQSLDISEKIEKIQQLNTNLLSPSDCATSEPLPISTANAKADTEPFQEGKQIAPTSSVNSNGNHRKLSTNYSSELEDSAINFNSNMSCSPMDGNSSISSTSASCKQSFRGKKQSMVSNANNTGTTHLQSPNFQINKSTDSCGSTNDFSLSSSSSISQKSAEFNTNANHSHLHQSNSINEEQVANYEPKKTNSSRTLIRQSTDLTSSFPLKPFQKINSQTVEIPGLNVKVVRYRIENDLGKIEPHLYTKYSSAGIETNQVISKGKIHLTMRYNEEIRSFSVTINKVEIYPNAKANLASNNFSSLAVSSNSRSQPNSPNLSKPDTYVKVIMLPDKKKKYQTKIQRKNLQPVFEETFYFQLPYEELNSRTLHLTLLEFGRFSRHELIGSVRISDLNLIKDLQTSDVEIVKNLLPLAEDDLELGELTLTLCYLPAAGRLTVTIVKAFNLKSMDINGKSDPYVKVTLLTKGKRVKKKKTSVMKNTLHPVYNESMLFDIPQDQIDQIDMIVKVIDYDRVGSNELIGCVGIGPSFNGIGRDHWYRMLENPRKPVTQTYFLRDNSFLKEGLPAKIEKALHAERQASIDSRGSDF
ncbi:synaptotagmin-10 isoform X2 [Brachionus plicatilis]|uniref:Synaptotagmin-10 isoform X2 n=1 Tax=Brachionus plicatilis TaxID=10195 RepID=A0A3M7QJ28_BRAPC|nr:synaptotagmin-10 isoform X2 [Brachionus plicatilis]